MIEEMNVNNRFFVKFWMSSKVVFFNDFFF